ncbi:type II toxin-antitoxin system YafO family toxin [Microbulbifer sp. EKSA005]|uniref:type II toxin-antitoxin system YafO family toxin n=1 Tax=Microbulbifer sp. EKSA005 TaxID=3243364 RepID=UPI0040430A67
MKEIRVFTHTWLRESMDEQKRKALVAEFKSYKGEEGMLPRSFGRDVPYDRTFRRSSLELMHLHYKEQGFPVRLLQYRRTSGYVLAYCPGFMEPNTYLLIGIIKHFDPRKPEEVINTDRDNNLMAKLEDIAENFREQY